MLGDSSERDKDSFRKPGIDAMMGLALLNASSNSGSNPGLTGNSACSVIMGPVSHSESSMCQPWARECSEHHKAKPAAGQEPLLNLSVEACSPASDLLPAIVGSPRGSISDP